MLKKLVILSTICLSTMVPFAVQASTISEFKTEEGTVQEGQLIFDAELNSPKEARINSSKNMSLDWLEWKKVDGATNLLAESIKIGVTSCDSSMKNVEFKVVNISNNATIASGKLSPGFTSNSISLAKNTNYIVYARGASSGGSATITVKTQ